MSSIGYRAFAECSGLNAVYVESGNYAFSRCSSVTSIAFESPTDWYWLLTLEGALDKSKLGGSESMHDEEYNAKKLSYLYHHCYWYKA